MYKVTIILVIGMLILPFSLIAQTIAITNVSDSVFCIGDSLTVSFTATGNYNANNVFALQLSTADGAFKQFQNIGSLKSTTSGIIHVQIPQINDGTGYRLRIMSSNPIEISPDNGSDITVWNNSYDPNSNFWCDNLLFPTQTGVQYSLSDSVDFTNIKWTFGNDATPAEYNGNTPPLVYYSTTGKKITSVEYTPGNKCVPNIKVTITVQVYDCISKVDSSAIVIDSTINADIEDSSFYNQTIWIMPGVILSLDGADNSIFYLETGSNLTIFNPYYCLFYLRAGASLTIFDPFECACVMSDLASLSDSASYYGLVDTLVCPNIQFDYTSAPQKGIGILQSLGYLSAVNDKNSSNELKVIQYQDEGRYEITATGDNINNLIIYDLLGQEIYRNDYQGKLSVDLSSSPAGCYLLSNSCCGKISNVKLLKL